MEVGSQFDLLSNTEIIGRRIEIENNIGTVRFSGNLTHQGRPAGSEAQRWLGIEWDDLSRGKHNGSVKDVTYFTTINNQNSGTLIKFEKADFGIQVLDGIFQQYFKEIPEGFKEKFNEALVDQKSKFTEKYMDPKSDEQENIKPKDTSSNTDSQSSTTLISGNEKQTEVPEQKQNELQTPQPTKVESLVQKTVTVETDSQAVFGTKKQNRKIVEFYGFDKIWEKLNNMETLKEISLVKASISDVGVIGYFSNLLPNLKVLSLEANLIFDWNQVYQIGYQLPLLESLSLINNKLIKPEKVRQLTSIKVFTDNSVLNIKPEGIFKSLRNLSLNDMRLTWREVCDIAPAFPNIEQLILCKNMFTDFENIDFDVENDFKCLKYLNLEMTDLEDFSGLSRFGQLPSLKILILNRNQLVKFGQIQGFKALTHLAIEANLIMDARTLSEISQLPELTYLNVKHNPVGDKCGKDYVRQRCVAQNPKITVINGSDLLQYQRKDCQYYYMRKSFDEFFTAFDQQYYEYDFEQFIEWAREHHPFVENLIKKYGNPYEINKEEKQQDVSSQNTVVRQKLIRVMVVIGAGPLLGNAPIEKQFPETTTIANLKNVFANILKIPADDQLLQYQVNKHDPMVNIQEDHKPLFFYGIMDDTEIIVESQSA